VSERRGERVPSTLAEHVIATVHPSSILRAPDDETRRTGLKHFIADLKKVARLLQRESDPLANQKRQRDVNTA
jgi:DNA polymerase